MKSTPNMAPFHRCLRNRRTRPFCVFMVERTTNSVDMSISWMTISALIPDSGPTATTLSTLHVRTSSNTCPVDFVTCSSPVKPPLIFVSGMLKLTLPPILNPFWTVTSYRDVVFRSALNVNFCS